MGRVIESQLSVIEFFRIVYVFSLLLCGRANAIHQRSIVIPAIDLLLYFPVLHSKAPPGAISHHITSRRSSIGFPFNWTISQPSLIHSPQQIVTGSIGSHLYVDKSVHCLVSLLSRVLNLEPVSIGHFMYFADREEIRISSRWAPTWMLSSITAYLHGHDQAFRKSSNNNGIDPVTNACWAISEGLRVGYWLP